MGGGLEPGKYDLPQVKHIDYSIDNVIYPTVDMRYVTIPSYVRTPLYYRLFQNSLTTLYYN